MDKLFICKTCNTIYKASRVDECVVCKGRGNDTGNVVEMTHDTPDIPEEFIRMAWKLFDESDIIDENKQLKESFMGFPKGTDRADVWRWFNDVYPGGMMHLMDDTQENGKAQKTAQGIIDEINETYAKHFTAPSSVLINGAYKDGMCSASIVGDRFSIDRVISVLMASSIDQMPGKCDPEKYLHALANNAYIIYQKKLQGT